MLQNHLIAKLLDMEHMILKDVDVFLISPCCMSGWSGGLVRIRHRAKRLFDCPANADINALAAGYISMKAIG